MDSESYHLKHALTLAEKLYIQRKSGQHCDVCICINETRFLAHKCVLSASSTKLDNLILEATKKNGIGRAIEIELNDLDHNGFEHVLEYFYKGNIDCNSQVLLSVLNVANYLDLRELVKRCSELLSITIRPEPIDTETTKSLSNLTTIQHVEHSILKEHSKKDTNIILNETGSHLDTSKLSPNSSIPVIYHTSTTDSQSYNHPTSSPIQLCDTDVIDIAMPCASTMVGSRELINTIPVNVEAVDRFNSNGGSKDCKTMMEQVGRLRLQHQQLQMLKQQQQQQQQQELLKQQHAYATFSNDSTLLVSEAKKARMSKPSKGSDEQAYIFNGSSHLQTSDHFTNQQINLTMTTNPRSVNPPADFRIVTEEVRQALYEKYDFFKPDTPVESTCDVEELLQRGKSRNRKTTEQNCLNNTIRLVLDTMRIVDSTDPRVEDALILIMDKFETLRSHINHQETRRSLRIKVRHSIHCKKWRIKKKKMQETSHLQSQNDEFPSMLSLKNTPHNTEDNLHG